MKKRDKIFISLFILAVVIFFVYIAFNYQHFDKEITTFVREYGYCSVFAMSFILDMLEQPIGPEVPASIALIVGLNFIYVFIFTVLGMVIASFVSYNVGKWLFHHHVMDMCSRKKHQSYCNLFENYGRISLFIASLTPVPYVFFCWLSGAFHMKIKDFILYGILPRIIRILVVLYVVSLFL